MLSFVKRMVRFSGEYAGRLKRSFVISFFEGLLQSVPIMLLWVVFQRLLAGTLTASDALLYGGVMVGAALVRIVLRYWFVKLESGAGYEICRRERIRLGERLRHFPMRFFSEGNLGNVASVVTVDLPFIEEQGMNGLDKVVSGTVTSVVGTILFCVVDWRVGLISVATFLLAALLFRAIEAECTRQSYIRQKQQSLLVGAVLEYVKGISVIKAFRLGGKRAKTIGDAIDTTCAHAIDYEVKLIKPVSLYRCCFAVGTAGTVLAAGLFALGGSLAPASAIMMLIYIYSLYTPAMAFSSLASQIRVMEAGLDRYEALQKQESMPEGMQPFPAGESGIALRDVTFAYNDATVLENVDFLARAKSVTALVGPSGGGKTTIANLIARFWDVQQGEVAIGGVDVRQMQYDSLLANISMVFQDVYLFNDTVRNNICFGTPGASEAQMIEAAQKARCHDFIMRLPQGYDTVISEGGGSLSGGEKQRISIARAMMKNAPIVILDEATASVDPDNEGDIQEAIGALIAGKTLIIIAHRLTTIQNAGQILVVDQKRILERGTHEELLALKGRYYSLWQRRQKAGGWRIGA